MHRTKVFIYEKLQFLDETLADNSMEDGVKMEESEGINQDDSLGTEQQVIIDNQECYEVIT